MEYSTRRWSETLLETLASIGTLAVFVGHDHDNSWCCPASLATGALMLCYGRHAGGYGTLTPGARIIDVRLEEKVTVETRWWNRVTAGYSHKNSWSSDNRVS